MQHSIGIAAPRPNTQQRNTRRSPSPVDRARPLSRPSSSSMSSSRGGPSFVDHLNDAWATTTSRRYRSRLILGVLAVGITTLTVSAVKGSGGSMLASQLGKRLDGVSEGMADELKGLAQKTLRSTEREVPYRSLYEGLPETKHLDGIGGYNMLENLYLSNGTFYAVTDTPEFIPPVTKIMSASPTPGGGLNPAGPDRWQVISREEAGELFGGNHVATRVRGTTFFLCDSKGPPPSGISAFLGHYFHFFAENFLGAWRLQTSLHAIATGTDSAVGVEMPARVMIGFAEPKDWHDRPGLIAWWLHNFLPDAAVEDNAVFADRAKGGSVYLLDRIAIVDRWASHRNNPTAKTWNKMNGDVVSIPGPSDWWGPLRSRALELAGSKDTQSAVPVLTYINRQKTGRRLVDEDDIALVAALQKLDEKGIIEFHNAFMEDIPRLEQFALALKTDILIGVHGNGLTHTMWQKPGSVLMEIMDDGGFMRDYQILGEVYGHDYYCIWNDKLNEEADWKARGPQKTSPGFYGSNIRVSSDFLSNLIIKIAKEKYHVTGR